LLAAPPRRLDPCPCGSGKRYRDCHGSLAPPAPPHPDFDAATALNAAGRHGEALALLDAALARSHDNEMQNLRGLVRVHLMDLERAVADFDAVIARDATHVFAHYNRGLVRLMRRDYPGGWADYAWRTRAPNYADYANFPFGMPRWKGEPLAGKRLLVHAEQGHGDTIQFARFLAPLAAQGAHIDVFCQPPLVSLMSRIEGVRSATGSLAERPTHDFHTSIMDAGILQLPAANAPHWRGAYVTALPEIAQRYAAALAHRPRPLIGIAWKGSALHTNDRNRSMPRELAKGLVRSGATFVNLQLGEPALAAEMIDPAPPLASWEDTAGLVSQLDLVVSVDTAVAHLAGAMGKPVLLLVPFSPDWRWGTGGEETPWYPDMRLLRQREPGGWRELIEAAVQRYGAR
jgi:hypothetical protein